MKGRGRRIPQSAPEKALGKTPEGNFVSKTLRRMETAMNLRSPGRVHITRKGAFQGNEDARPLLKAVSKFQG